MNRYKYLLAFTLPLSVALSLEWGDRRAFFAVLYGFVLLPFFELLLPVSSRPLPQIEERGLESDRLYDGMLWLMVPIQYGLLLFFCFRISSEGMSPIVGLALISAFGLACGVIGINVAHELGHRKSRFERVLARALLATSLNWQFYVEHNRGHHRNVGTPGDTETSMLNESLYRFWIRAIRDSFLGAWMRDRNEMILGIAVEFFLMAAIYSAFGGRALAGFVGSALFGVLLLQSVNYIEHYGLTRKRLTSGGYEQVMAHHSWNSSHMLSRAMLFELSRHSDHHANVTRKYQILRHLEESPQMPVGYPSMIILALIPPLWFKVMNPRVLASQASHSLPL